MIWKPLKQVIAKACGLSINSADKSEEDMKNFLEV